MLSLPTWNLENPRQSNSTLGFGYDDKVDPTLDKQSREVTRSFLRNLLDDMRVKGARGTNVTTQVPKDLRFEVPVELNGRRYNVAYAGGDAVVATRDDGQRTELKLGRTRIEAMYLDHLAFGDLKAQMTYALSDPRSVRPSGLPF